MDIPASDPNSSGIFDGNIEPAPGKTLRETTKELVETLKANAIKHQGYAFRELMEKYVNDPHGLEHLRNLQGAVRTRCQITRQRTMRITVFEPILR